MSQDARIISDILVNNRHLENLLFVFGSVGIVCFATIVTTWIKYRAKRVGSSDISGQLGEMADRMAKLDNAVETMAIEIERISEGQRFVTKILAERSASPALSEAARSGSLPPHR